MSISNRERFKAIARFQRPGDLFTTEMTWPETLSNWVQQGAPEKILMSEPGMMIQPYGNRFFREYFQHGNKVGTDEVKSGFRTAKTIDLGHGISTIGGSPLFPDFDAKIISQDDRTFTYLSGHGQVAKMLNKGYSMPMFIDWPIKDRATWHEFKKRLDPHTPERWPSDWQAYVKKLNSQDDPVVLDVGGFYGFAREWIGTERLLYMFHDDPVLIEDIMEHALYFETEIIKRVVKDIKVDEADFLEDMAYKSGSFISPAMIRKYIMPRYKKITELLRNNGVDIIFVDSDGNVEQLIPIWLESGINYVWPLEQAAGNDAVALRKKFGKDLILSGAIDKRELMKGKEEIKKEVMSKVPFLLEKGGYFPTVDHAVPPDISLENYCYYINTLREAAGLEKLSF
jgi:hypothetical protein